MLDNRLIDGERDGFLTGVASGTDDTQQFGKFGFGTFKFMQPVQAEQSPNRPVVEPGEQKDPPPENGSRNP